ncbi:MAG TPA: sulfatase-like hydrolase/transferase [Chryseolinea sp.]|nr:sulfatase-like hydrolase/transferase [Chryseolinea sp.]
MIPADAKLTARPDGLPAWESLNADQKRLYARMMEVFAAYGAHCDHEMGRIIEAVKQLPDADNTMIIYIAGDNGSSAEGGIEGSLNENLFFNGFPEKWQDNLKVIDELGGPKHFNHFTSAWAHAMNTPFQWTKQVASHFGGTRNPMIISWPAKIQEKGGLRSQFVHTIDVVPTIYEACGITAPSVLNGITQKPVEGYSFLATLSDPKIVVRKTQYFELGVNRGIYDNGWMASAVSFAPWDPNRGDFDPDKQKWELYNIDEDFSQANDLASQQPEKLRQMEDLWWVEAAKYNVLPLDWRAVIRMNAEAMGRPTLMGHRKSMTYYAGTIGLPDAASPNMTNKSWTVTADFETTGKQSGIIVTHGGLEGGYAIYLRDGKPTFVYNYLSIDRPTLASKTALPAGKVKLVVDFTYDGGGMGKGGKVTMTANGKKIGEQRLEKTIPIQFSITEGLDVGMDIGSAIDFTYKLPFAYPGKIEKVTIDLK